MDWLSDPTAWAGLATLIALEIVLGIDNLVFIAILADKLPPHQRARARTIGLSLALIMRLVLLASISWIVKLTAPLFDILGNEISWRDIILIGGGAFLLFKGTMELHERLEGAHGDKSSNGVQVKFWHVIAQIVVLDAVFSLDSVITAVGMVDHLPVMVIAVIVAIAVMMLASEPLMQFVSRHPTVVILCLGFLLMIGFSLVVEGLGFHIPKGYLYAAIGFSILIEAANQVGRRNVARRVSSMHLRDRTAQAVLRLLRGGDDATTSSEEIAAIVSSSKGEAAFGPEESAIIERALTVGQRSVSDIMTPRLQVEWIDASRPSDELLVAIRACPHEQLLMSDGELDNVLGVATKSALLDQALRGEPLDAKSVVQEVIVVPEWTPVVRVLEGFKSKPVRMAVITDEYGILKGIVTQTDLLGAIAGDLPEIGDDQPWIVERAGAFVIDGRTPVQDMTGKLGLGAPPANRDYHTAAGFALSILGRLPRVGESFAYGAWRFEIAGMDGKRIDQIVATRGDGAS